MPTVTAAGSLVEVRGERWLLTSASTHGSCTVLTLEGRDRANARQRLRVIEPFDRSRPIITARARRRPRRAVLRAALSAIVNARLANGLWTASAAAIELWPYQLEPALAAIGGATRLLLADAVGLGKTIQAGLLLSELRERGWIERALIVCPAGLRETWARELLTRFGIRAAVLDQGAIAERVARLPPGMNPWAGDDVAIASIDLVKRTEVMAAIEREPIGLLIADEAHHLTPGTDRGEAVSRLASRATWCVLLSATPHSGDEAAFEYLANIGKQRDALTIFRRSRPDIGLAIARRTHLLPVRPTAEEAALFAALDRYTRAIWRERGRLDHAVRLIAVTLSRRAASSARAIERTLSRRLALIGSTAAVPSQPLLPWDDEDEGDRNDDVLMSTPGLDNAIEERACLQRLIDLARRCLVSSKLRRLARMLGRLHEPAVVFTEYRDSLEAVLTVLRSTRRVAAIHGGISIALRQAAVDAFNGGDVDVLVATDAAGEGLNLHHRCRLVVDLELPWNPLRLEQRVGRVDRLGQHRMVHAIRLFHPGTIEQHVLEQLRLRDRRARAALEPHHVTEAMIAGAIFDGDYVQAPTISIASARIAAASSEAQRLEAQRRVQLLTPGRHNGMSWTAPPSGRRSNLVCLTRRSFTNALGAVIHEAFDARMCAVAPMRNVRECRQAIERERDGLMPIPSADVALIEGLAESRALLHKRIGAIRAQLHARVEEQSSLFDRRVETASTARHEAIRKRDEALSRTIQAIAPPIDERTRAELIAVWPETSR